MYFKNKQSIKVRCLKWGLIHIIIMFIIMISFDCQANKVLFNSSYYLLSQSDKIFIPINQSTFTVSNNGTIKFVKVQVKIQNLNSNGTYVDSPFQTGNILVKYWKNHQNTQASSILTYSYEKLSTKKQFPTAIDTNDNGIVDIQSMYNYKNDHNFVHLIGNETSDTLFVISVYRFANFGLTDILGMSKKSDEIKVTVTVIKGTPADSRCQFCSSKTFCPVAQCFCSQQTYSGCNISKKKITTKIDKSPKTKDIDTLIKGQIQYIQIEPSTTTQQWFPVQLSFSLQNSNSSITQGPKKDKIFLLLYVQDKNSTADTIPNIYNFDFIDSPSLTSIISRQSAVSSAVANTNQHFFVGTGQNSISMSEKILLSNNQLISAAIYYLNDTQGSSTQNNNSLSVSMNIDFSNTQNQGKQSEIPINLALIIGMVAVGLFVLILLICLLHFFVSRRFNFLSIFSQLQNSNRNSVNSARFSRNQNVQDLKLSLPTVSFDFLNDLVFKPLKYIYQKNLQQNYSKFTATSKIKLGEQNEMCSICLQQFTNQSKVKYTYCGHVLDSKCLDSWLQKQMSCPLCRQKLQIKDVSKYEDMILQEIVENAHYQSIIDEEAETLKNLYKSWKNNRNRPSYIMENTEESLVNNQYACSRKFIENSVIPNISTMVQLQRTDHNLKQSTNKKVDQNPSSVLIKTQNSFNLNNVFLNNQLFSVKRLSKNYLFYRCIFLHHQINKNFDKHSELNLYQSDLSVQKDHSILCESRRQQIQEQQNAKNIQNNIITLVQTQPYIIKPYIEQEQSLQLYLSSANKIKNQLSNSQINQNNKPEFSLYFDTDHLSNQVQKQEKSKIYRDDTYSSHSGQKNKQKSGDPENSKSDKIKKRKNKRITIRQEMNQLQRQLQQSQKKQEPIKQSMKFSQKAPSVILFQESQDQNVRYAGAPVSMISGQNKSQSSKNCHINRTQVLVLSHRKKQPIIGQQTLKTLPYSVCLDPNPPISYRKASHYQQKQKINQRFAKKILNLQRI